MIKDIVEKQRITQEEINELKRHLKNHREREEHLAFLIKSQWEFLDRQKLPEHVLMAIRNIEQWSKEYGENQAETANCDRVLAKAEVLRTGIHSEAIDAVMKSHFEVMRKHVERCRQTEKERQ